MLQKLVYSKFPRDEEGKVTVENIINLNKKNKTKNKKHKGQKIDLPLQINSNNINSDSDNNNILIFESKFESGNLQLAYKIEDNKYQLFLHHDTNTTGYIQWFFFRVTNTKKGSKTNFSIMNLMRLKSKYCYGIKIWYYSTKKNKSDNKGWCHTNENVNYNINNLYRLFKGLRQFFYTLSFDYTFEYDDDEVYFANCIPYTYTDIMRELNEYQKYENTKYPFLTRKTLCNTLAGNDLDYLIINSNQAESNNNDKEGIVLFARQHPSETVGSWVILGAIEFLLGNSDEAKYLRDNFVIKILPMMNPDGVICGNTRTSIAGCDLNRRWDNPSEIFHPEIFYAKELIVRFANHIKINCIVDFHGHFGAFNSFIYANKKEQFELCRMLPFTCAKKSKVISFERSRFSMPKFKKGTGRIDLFTELQIENIFTLETSYFGCVMGEYKNKYFTTHILKQIGVDVCIGILINYYNTRNKMGIVNLFGYSEIERKIANEAKEIEKDFMIYCDRENGNKDEEKKKEEEKEKQREEKRNKKINNSNNNSNSNSTNLIDDIEINKAIDDDDNDNPENDEDDSESEPSFDNLDMDVINKLLPKESKKLHKRKKKKTKTSKKLKLFQHISFGKKQLIEPTPLQNLIKKNFSLPKLQVPNKHKDKDKDKDKVKNLNQVFKEIRIKPSFSSLSKNMSSLNERNTIDFLVNNNNDTENNNKDCNAIRDIHRIRTPFINKESFSGNLRILHKVNAETQTEEMYFKMHWSYFLGVCTILGPKFGFESKFQKRTKSLNEVIYMQNYFNYDIKKKIALISAGKENGNNNNNSNNNNKLMKFRNFNQLNLGDCYFNFLIKNHK